MPEDRLKMKFARTRISVDTAKYQAMLDAPEFTQDEKRELCERLWQILMVFVDLGFELHSIEVPCGKLDGMDSSECAESVDMLELEEFLKGRFEDAARTD